MMTAVVGGLGAALLSCVIGPPPTVPEGVSPARDPGFAPAWFQLAMAAVAASRHGEAAEAARAAGASHERLDGPQRDAMKVLIPFLEGRFDEALSIDAPGNPHAAWLRGLIHAGVCERFDAGAAGQELEVASREESLSGPALDARIDLMELCGIPLLEPGPGMPVSRQGRIRMLRGEHREAMEAADELIRAGEDVYAHGLAPAFILSGEHELLASMYDAEREGTSTPRVNALTHLHAGINEVWRGRMERAAGHFARGPEFLAAPWRAGHAAMLDLLRARVLALMDRTQEAAMALREAAQAAGERPVLGWAEGVLAIRSGDRPGAARTLARMPPGDPWTGLLAGEIALAEGRPSEGDALVRGAWERARGAPPDCVVGAVDVWFLDAVGRAGLAAGRAEEAVAVFRSLRDLGARGLRAPDLAVMALYHSGRALESAGRPGEAAAAYAAFLRLWEQAGVEASAIRHAKEFLESRGGDTP